MTSPILVVVDPEAVENGSDNQKNRIHFDGTSSTAASITLSTLRTQQQQDRRKKQPKCCNAVVVVVDVHIKSVQSEASASSHHRQRGRHPDRTRGSGSMRMPQCNIV